MTILGQSSQEMLEVELDKIYVNPHQPRKSFSEGELEELAESIKTVGLLHPPLVRRREEDDGFEIISGERRCRACKIAGFTSIRVIVREAGEMVSAQAALIENIQRVDLNPLEISKALKSLMEEFHFGQDELALKVGKKRSTVANYLRLLSLPKNIQDSLSAQSITMGHAKAILSIEGEDRQNLLHEMILRDGMSVREAEESAQKLHEKAKKKQLIYVTRDFYLEELAKKVEDKLGTSVEIQNKGKKGRVVLDYYDLDDLERLLSLLGVSL